MKNTRLLLVPALSLVVCGFALPGDTLAFHVAAQKKLEKSFETKLSMESKSISFTIDGNPIDEGIGDVKYELKTVETALVIDEYLAVEDGRPTKIRRSFEKLGGKSEQKTTPSDAGEGDPDEGSHDESSKLEGKQVLFTWDDKDEHYTPTWVEEKKGDEKLLEGLEGDMDLLALLPSKAVADGDTWTIDAKVFNAVLSPGGRLHLLAEGDDEDTSQEDEFAALLKNMTGKVSATYKGSREVKGEKLGVIELKAQLASKADLERDEGKQALSIELDLEGELLWNPKQGHFAKLEVKAQVQFAMESSASIETDDGQHEFKNKLEFTGELEISGSADDSKGD